MVYVVDQEGMLLTKSEAMAVLGRNQEQVEKLMKPNFGYGISLSQNYVKLQKSKNNQEDTM